MLRFTPFVLSSILLVPGADTYAQNTEDLVTVSVFDHYSIEPLEFVQVSVWKNGERIALGTTGSDGRMLFDLTGVGISTELPDRLHISQNYPNPFTIETRLNVTAPGFESLPYEVYNVLGQRVLADRLNLNPGFQTVSLSLSHLPAGIYFLRVNRPVVEAFRLIKVGAGTVPHAPAAPAASDLSAS